MDEAKAHRKFEDVKTLKINLIEIKSEIDQILANVQGGMLYNGPNTSARA